MAWPFHLMGLGVGLSSGVLLGLIKSTEYTLKR